MTKRIDKDTWLIAISGRDNSKSASDIRDWTEKGYVIVVDKDGSELIPVKHEDGSWKLEPKKP